MNQPRHLQTLLLDGTAEGARVLKCESIVQAFVVPRIALPQIKDYPAASFPALYFLIDADGERAYIGESDNFYSRIKNHDQNKDWWDLAIAIVSIDNSLHKGSVKYLESLAVERARGGSFKIDNKVQPVRNNIDAFSVHTMERILDDAQLILTSLRYDLLSPPKEKKEEVWHMTTKFGTVYGAYRGDQFVLQAGSKIRVAMTAQWEAEHSKTVAFRNEVLSTKATLEGEVATLNENIAFRSVSNAAGFATGRFVNGWIVWKNNDGLTMDEVMRKSER